MEVISILGVLFSILIPYASITTDRVACREDAWGPYEADDIKMGVR